MTTTDQEAPPAEPIWCIQPGGGWVMQLELAWGRCRRRYLRRFRPGYVQRMVAQRQGDCPGCQHDIIDPRDLKYYRNVCGYHFRSEDDAFRWRGQLGLRGAGLVELILASSLLGAAAVLLGLATAFMHGLFALPLVAVLLLWAEVIYFFRDPERPIPADPDLVLSPADGTITHVGEVDEPDFPGGRAFRISIFLSIFNVHVNRVPRGGRVVALRYARGRFLDARHADCAVQNEQFWIDLEENGTGRHVRVKQIVGLLARRIVCWLRVGEEVQAGERFGMIKFGLRTDVLVRVGDAMEVRVKVGDKVKGGSTVLLKYPS